MCDSDSCYVFDFSRQTSQPQQLFAAEQGQPVSPSNLLLREAAYRAVGEGFAHVHQHIDFTAWYASELQGLLEKGYTVSCPHTLWPVLLVVPVWV